MVSFFAAVQRALRPARRRILRFHLLSVCVAGTARHESAFAVRAVDAPVRVRAAFPGDAAVQRRDTTEPQFWELELRARARGLPFLPVHCTTGT